MLVLRAAKVKNPGPKVPTQQQNTGHQTHPQMLPDKPGQQEEACYTKRQAMPGETLTLTNTSGTRVTIQQPSCSGLFQIDSVFTLTTSENTINRIDITGWRIKVRSPASP